MRWRKHLYECFEEPVQTGLAKRDRRWDRGSDAGSSMYPEAGAATDPASARVDRHGHQFDRGWINLITLLLRRFASFESCRPSRFGDPKGNTLRIPSAKGFKSRSASEEAAAWFPGS